MALRGVKVAAAIAQALRTVEQDPVLVGGAAVEFYTEGGYATKDIDMLASGGPDLWKVMEMLGFKRRGKDYINESLELYVEFPGDFLAGDERNDILDVNGIPLRIISIEDLVVDRLCAYKFWKSAIDGVSVLLLLESGRCDLNYLSAQARKKDVLDALKMIQKIYEEVVRKKLSKKRSSKALQDWLSKPAR